MNEPLTLVVNPEMDIELVKKIREIWATVRGLGFSVEWLYLDDYLESEPPNSVLVVNDSYSEWNDPKAFQLIYVKDLGDEVELVGVNQAYMFTCCDELRDLLIYLSDVGLDTFLMEMRKDLR